MLQNKNMLVRDLCEYCEVPKLELADSHLTFPLQNPGKIYYGGKLDDKETIPRFVVKVQVSVSLGEFPILCYNKVND